MAKQTGKRVYERPRGQRARLGEREKTRLAQLGVCLVLFLTVFFTKGADRLAPLGEELGRWVRLDADFGAAMTDLTWSVASGRPVGETLGELWSDVFLPRKGSVTAAGTGRQQTERMTLEKQPLARFLTGPEEGEEMEEPPPSPAPAPSIAPAAEGEGEPEVIHVDYTGPDLPDNTTMDRYALGLSETVDPVDGVLSSPFGWREHPIDGGEKFHYGVDLAVDSGTTVAAFAAGTVDYIGESEVYGQYLQLDHGNGIKTFYAHCSKLCVQQGERVTAGEKVAESGATGEVTGPHLHFEVKREGVRLDPVYYIHCRL